MGNLSNRYLQELERKGPSFLFSCLKTSVWTKKFLKLKGTPPLPAVTPGCGRHLSLHEPPFRWLLPFSQLRGYSSGWDSGRTRGARSQAAERPFRTFSKVDYLLNSISTRIIMWLIPGNWDGSLLWRNYFKPFSQYNFILQGKKKPSLKIFLIQNSPVSWILQSTLYVVSCWLSRHWLANL